MPCRLPTDAPYYRSSRSSVPSKAASLLLGVSFSRKLETIIPNSMLELNLIVYEWRGMSAKSKRQAIQRIGVPLSPPTSHDPSLSSQFE